MTKLVLSGLYINPQNEKEAQAYLVDETKKTKPDGEIPTDFIKYLETVVVPQIKKTLLKSAYETGVVACDQGSAPFVTVLRKNKEPLVDADVFAIQKYISRALQSLNTPKKLAKQSFHAPIEQKEVKRTNQLKLA